MISRWDIYDHRSRMVIRTDTEEDLSRQICAQWNTEDAESFGPTGPYEVRQQTSTTEAVVQ